jgi:hypothetical protein
VGDRQKATVGFARRKRAIGKVRRLDDLLEFTIDAAATVRPVARDARSGRARLVAPLLKRT